MHSSIMLQCLSYLYTVPELKIVVTALTGGRRAAEKVNPGSRDARHFFSENDKKTAEICTKESENDKK